MLYWEGYYTDLGKVTHNNKHNGIATKTLEFFFKEEK